MGCGMSRTCSSGSRLIWKGIAGSVRGVSLHLVAFPASPEEPPDFATFMALLPAFTTAMERYLTRYTLDGYLRESDRAITYTNSPLPSPEDRLLFILTYLKQNAIQEAHGQLFAMTQSNVS